MIPQSEENLTLNLMLVYGRISMLDPMLDYRNLT